MLAGHRKTTVIIEYQVRSLAGSASVLNLRIEGRTPYLNSMLIRPRPFFAFRGAALLLGAIACPLVPLVALMPGSASRPLPSTAIFYSFL
jgi:hypothetical protein